MYHFQLGESLSYIYIYIVHSLVPKSSKRLFIIEFGKSIVHPRKLKWIPKMNQNDGLEKADSFKIWPCLTSMFDFWSVFMGIICVSSLARIVSVTRPTRAIN